jgi:hypothetical protein
MHERAKVVLWSEGPGAILFRRDAARLGAIARKRYFETSVHTAPAHRVCGRVVRRGRSVAHSVAMDGKAIARHSARRFTTHAAAGVPERAIVSVQLDRRLLERIDAPRGTLERTWRRAGARARDRDFACRAPAERRERARVAAGRARGYG